MNTFFTADTHFSHARIIELCNRPFADIEEMDEEILERINSTVTEKDRLVILGDVCMGKLETSLGRLGRSELANLYLSQATTTGGVLRTITKMMLPRSVKPFV